MDFVVTESFLTINGLRLRYRLAGEGPLAVFGHGLLGSIEQIESHVGSLDALNGMARLLVYDARGHGQSEGPEDAAAYTWETLGLDMVGFADAFGEETAVFGGASMGAASALWAAVERPERVRALVMVMPPPLGPLDIRGPEEHPAVKALDFISAAVQVYGLERTAELARTMPGIPGDPEERAAWVRAQDPRALGFAVRGLINASIHDPEAYRSVRAPTLVIAHEGDPLHPVRAARLLKEKIPHARLTVAPEPGYWRSHPDEFFREVRAFREAVG
jgi:pimeloyl-ACP methyl ester carboxylesterase